MKMEFYDSDPFLITMHFYLSSSHPSLHIALMEFEAIHGIY